MKQSAAEWQHVGSSAVGEEAEVADAGESLGVAHARGIGAGTLREQVSSCAACCGEHSPSSGSGPQQLRPKSKRWFEMATR